MADIMKLTKKEAILRHRELWNWIATESLRQKRAVSKKEAFEHFGWASCECYCWSCEYDKENVDVHLFCKRNNQKQKTNL